MPTVQGQHRRWLDGIITPASRVVSSAEAPEFDAAPAVSDSLEPSLDDDEEKSNVQLPFDQRV